MKVIVVGAGEVGYYLSDILSQMGFDITIIEENQVKIQEVDEELDVKVMQGNGSSASMLEKAGVRKAGFVISVTSDDATNIICCSLAKAINPSASTVARVHDATYADHSLINYQLHFGIDYLLNPEALCAVELAKEIRNPGRVAVENFARGKIEVQQIEVAKSSRMTGKPLKDVKLPEGVRIATVIHANDEYQIAKADTVIEKGDLVTLFGTPEPMMDVKTQLDPASKIAASRVVLYGGSEIAISLVRLLNNPRFKIRILEKNESVCRMLAELFPNVTVIHGDATSRRLLEEEQVGSADYFVACTKRDEDNIMTSIQASKLGVKHVQLVINKPDYEPVVTNLKETLGVELIVSPRTATGNELKRVISSNTANELAELAETKAIILEVLVGEKGQAVGKKLRDLPHSTETIFLAILHKFDAKVPTADDVILAGDRVVVLTNHQSKQSVIDLLT
ncbi:MAG: Trk system potassium transporter TrkA [Opitutales bacterium]|nr:Trk system potassium transporter TrkA [Opitutales bacterium]